MNELIEALLPFIILILIAILIAIVVLSLGA